MSYYDSNISVFPATPEGDFGCNCSFDDAVLAYIEPYAGTLFEKSLAKIFHR